MTPTPPPPLVRYLIGLEGLALLRGWLARDQDEAAARRVGEIDALITRQTDLAREPAPEELSVQEGYAAWASGYDVHENPLIAVEEPVVRELTHGPAPAGALDAACGTGRHAAFLASLGHDVVGVDATAEMLAVAREKVPGADFRQGRLEALPLADGSVDLAICALALSHAPALEEPVSELARVLRRGGRLVVSDLHPILSALGGNALFTRPDGTSAFVRDAERFHSDYLTAFRAAGLTVRACVEPRWTPQTTRMIGKAARRIPEALDAALVGLPCVVVWDLERS